MKTALYEYHCALGAKMVPFAGWEMPVQYAGILQEHQVVRSDVGVFDVSHMGRVSIEGPEAEKLMDFLSTNTIAGKKEGSATYTVWCHEDGGCVDDLIVYKEAKEKFFVIVNAGNREKDLTHLKRIAERYDVAIKEHYEDGILAIQGPKAEQLLPTLIPGVEEVKPMRFRRFSYQGREITVAGTGYTGSGGYEVYAPSTAIVTLWEALMKKGVQPIGLGARDTLRLEMGYALYGHELSDTIAPTESVSAWTVRMKKESFLGKEALEKLANSGKQRAMYPVILEGKGIAREGYQVFQGEEVLGVVTSGTFSPSMGFAIALILVERKLEEGENVEIQIRKNRCQARVVKLPFYEVAVNV